MRVTDLVSVVMLVLSVAVAHGANARIARLIYSDEITDPIRKKMVDKWGKKNLLVRWCHCPWCCGWWTAWPVTALAWFPVIGTRWWWVFPLAVFSVAQAAGRLNHGS